MNDDFCKVLHFFRQWAAATTQHPFCSPLIPHKTRVACSAQFVPLSQSLTWNSQKHNISRGKRIWFWLHDSCYEPRNSPIHNCNFICLPFWQAWWISWKWLLAQKKLFSRWVSANCDAWIFVLMDLQKPDFSSYICTIFYQWCNISATHRVYSKKESLSWFWVISALHQLVCSIYHGYYALTITQKPHIKNILSQN